MSRRLSRAVLAAGLMALPSAADEKTTPNYLALPGTDTRLRIYGVAWINSWYYFDENLKDTGCLVAGKADPLNAVSTPDRQFGMTAKNSRIGFTTTTPSAWLGDVIILVEMDFSRDQAKNGGFNLRHAYATIGNWTLGYTWSNWLDLEGNGETVDMNGPVGQACNGTSRFTQVRCRFPITRRSSLAFSVEQNQMAWEQFQDVVNAPKPAPPAPPATLPDARYPTVTAAYTFSDRRGHVALRAMAQNYGAYTPPAKGNPEYRINRWGGAVQLSGGLRLGKDQLVGSVYTGEGLGEYGTGIQGMRFVGVDQPFLPYRNYGWQAGYTHAWTDKVRSNLVLGAVAFSDNAAALPTNIQDATNCFVNTFVKLSRNVELGLEYGYENLHTFGSTAVTHRGGASGQNQSNKLQVSLTATF
jgi:hypothetical protein